MSQAARYLFDLDFSAPPEPEFEENIEEIPPEPMITVAEHERLLAAAIEQASAQGEAKALNNREKLASEESLQVQKAMLNDTAMIYTEVGLLMQRLEKDASMLAFAFASRFAERLVAQEPKAEIMALLNQILAPLRQTPHILIRLSEDVAEEIETIVNQQMLELGFDGKLTILPDASVMPGDCEVEWADGGIGRNLRSSIRQVEQLIEDHFAHVPDSEDDEEDQDEGQEGPETSSNDMPEDTAEEAPDDASADEAMADEPLADEPEDNQEDSQTDNMAADSSDMSNPRDEEIEQPDQFQSLDAEAEQGSIDDEQAVPPAPMLDETSDVDAPTDAAPQTDDQPIAESVSEPARQDAMGDTK